MDGVAPTVQPHDYPRRPHRRRHGPYGYADYEPYRPWLEDEFVFRCVYCLKRVVWVPTDIWAIDHLIPQEEAPELDCDYENLLFACQRCNQRKRDHRVPDPCKLAYGLCLRVEPTGLVTPLNRPGRRLVEVIRLNHPRYVEERRKTLRALRVLAQHDFEEFERLMGFPANLPDLAKLKPPGNRRPDGVAQSWFAKRKRGELPRVY